jgi:4'-phosphopantetheinyl transferase
VTLHGVELSPSPGLADQGDAVPGASVHLWLCRLDEIREQSLLDAYVSLLVPSELATGARLHFERDRKRHLATRAMVRTVLSHYVPIPPKAWRFESNRFGRPQIANLHPLAQPISFNVSHSGEIVLVAVAVGRAVGVDVERCPMGAVTNLADRFFSGAEASDLRSLPAALRAARFLDLWTLKESYVKARGMGLSIPLDHVQFELSSDNNIGFKFADGFDDSPQRWWFAQVNALDRYMIAVCVESLGGNSLGVVMRATVPLRYERMITCTVVRQS